MKDLFKIRLPRTGVLGRGNFEGGNIEGHGGQAIGAC